MKYLTILFILTFSHLSAQIFPEQKLKTKITEATVFTEGAQVTREGKALLKNGKTKLILNGLSPHVDSKSIKVKSKGDLKIISVNHSLNYLERLKLNKKVDSLQSIINDYDAELDRRSARLSILAEQQSLLNANKHLGGDNSVSLDQLENAIGFYEKTLTSILNEEIQIKQKIKEIKEIRTRLKKEIAEVKKNEVLPTSDVEIRIETKRQNQAEFTITYLVSNAGWFPTYDVRVKNISEPLVLSYKADVYQNTGVDWNNVKLKFSNANPNKSGVAPELNPWHLNYARNTIFDDLIVSNSVRQVSGKIIESEDGMGMPGVNVIVKGSTVGTITDLNGNFSLTLPNGAEDLAVSFIGYLSKEIKIDKSYYLIKMTPDINQLSEVVITGAAGASSSKVKIRGSSSLYGSRAANLENLITTTTITNQTTVDFSVPIPYTLPSNHEKMTVDLKNYEIDADYHYFAVPKLDKEAFLMARITNWDNYHLLEGEVNLYFEEAFVGRSVLDASTLKDTLDISLGRDKSILIGRSQNEKFSKKRTLGSNISKSIGYDLMVRNKKSEEIKITVYDQIPKPVINTINVSVQKLSEGDLDEETGIIKWELNIKPQEQKEFDFAYQVKYPKREDIILQ